MGELPQSRGSRIGSLKRFAAFSRLRNVRLTGGGGLLRSHVVYERSPSSIAFGLAFVVLVVIGPAYLVSLPFCWALGETLGVRIENGFALFTLFGMTTAMVLRIRSWRQDARMLCERANVRQRRHAPAEALPSAGLRRR
jgi:hypothetical protein